MLTRWPLELPRQQRSSRKLLWIALTILGLVAFWAAVLYEVVDK